jgi:hypothetical protein
VASKGYAGQGRPKVEETRFFICSDCLLPSDLKLGLSYAERACKRCGKTVPVATVVDEPKERRTR